MCVCVRVCVMYHFPFTKLPALTDGTHVLDECAARGEVVVGGGALVDPEICNFKHGCIHENARGHQLDTYIAAVQAVWRR